MNSTKEQHSSLTLRKCFIFTYFLSSRRIILSFVKKYNSDVRWFSPTKETFKKLIEISPYLRISLRNIRRDDQNQFSKTDNKIINTFTDDLQFLKIF